MAFSDYLEEAILKHLFGLGEFTKPSSVYVGLATAAITDETTGSTVTEPSTGAYARVTVTNVSANWVAADGTPSTKKNDVVITFPEATASWGTVTYFFIADAATAGNILIYGQLSTQKVIDSGDIPRFNAESLSITMN